MTAGNVLPFPDIGPLTGGGLVNLLPGDRGNLCREHWLTNKILDAAGVRRVPDDIGRMLTGWARRDCSGIILPYPMLDGSYSVFFRIRRDKPDVRLDLRGGEKIERKYAAAYGSRNYCYWSPGTTQAQLDDAALPIIITEGEYKTLALYRLANYEVSKSRFLAVGLGGVDSWIGKDGKTLQPDGSTRDSSGIIPDMRRIAWKDRKVIIAYDADLHRKPAVKGARRRLAGEMRAAGAIVSFLEWEERDGKGIDDWLATVGPEAVLVAIGDINWDLTTGWRALLDRAEGKAPRAHVLNVLLALKHAPEWDGVIGYNEFSGEIMLTSKPPYGVSGVRKWRDIDEVNTAAWMQEKGLNVSPSIVGQAVAAHAEANPFHPIRQYLQSLQWDGDPRIDSWLTEFLGVFPSEYTAQVGRLWLISAVARVMQPGCKADHMLLLEGEQGIGKSSVLKVLASESWFTDQMPDINTKDAQLQTIGFWIIEWGELDALQRSETLAVKAFISRQREQFRRPYGKNVEDFPRQCVFAGTSNKDEHFDDDTGNRRFWPVACTFADPAGVAGVRDQIWAEAYDRYQNGAHWWLESETVIKLAKEEQAARMRTDPWSAKVAELSELLTETTADDMLDKLNIPNSMVNLSMRSRVGKCLQQAGFKRKSKREGARVVKNWVRK